MDGFFYYVDDVRNCKANDYKCRKNYYWVMEECNGSSAKHQQVSVREPDVGGVVTYVCKAGVQPLWALDAQEHDIIGIMNSGSMSVDAPMNMRPVNNRSSITVQTVDMPMCRRRVMHECEMLSFMLMTHLSISELRAKSAPTKNMKNNSVALNKFLMTTPPKLSNVISVL